MADHVDVTGTGTASGTPDVVALDVRVLVEDREVAGALAGLATRLTAALDAAAEHGVAAADRRTTSMGVSPRWDREGREVTGYQASQSVRVRLRERDRTGEVLAALAEAAGDALSVDGVSLEVADPGPLVERARTAAFTQARATASQYAGLAGRPLGPVLEIDEVPDPGGPAPRMRLASMSAEGGVPVEAGESAVSVTVRVRFALEPA
ncbi:SIMPL domain-containing protein [Phycicoccus flavus]|uniref:SIMPL domain-containing protein n=1 Tax=Phycicoccus flavus TaxID=2502783 RepID=A0A8T6R629_9MICO|nr:SIMPL domain-containing protein [Phycicoccus flavus]NHA69212.1 SIMPL domain-containing protein [Phycicoccus flavus]